jgi:hypothetical protein
MNTLWIARDEDGELNIYRAKPEIFDSGDSEYYSCDDTGYYGGLDMPLPTELFPEITFESGPVEVELKIKKP